MWPPLSCVLHIIALFVIGWHTVGLACAHTCTSTHAILCRSRSVIRAPNGFFKMIFFCALWYERWFVLISWPRRDATGNFCAWRVPPHNDARKHNLISTFIYRTDCSNGVITICRYAPSLFPLPARTPAALFQAEAHLKPCKWEQVNKWMFHECFLWWEMQMRMKWMDECLMNAC